MFGSPSKRVQAVQVLNTKPMTKTQYYARHFGNTFIALFVIALAVLVIGILIATGVIHVKGYNGEIEALNNFINTTPGTDEALGIVPLTVTNAIKDFITANPNWENIVQTQDKLDYFGQAIIVISGIVMFASAVGIYICSFIGRLDVPVSAKKEAKLRAKLKKFEYNTLRKVINSQNKTANKELKAQKLAEYKAKKK